MKIRVEVQIDLLFDGRQHADMGVVVGFLLTARLDDGLQDGAEDLLNQ
jgi:hypothetical protein